MIVKRVIMDLDEVVVQFIQPVIDRYNYRYGSDLTIEDITQWGLPADMCEIFHEPNFFARLIPYPGSIRGMGCLRAWGFEVIIASSPSGNPGIALQKLAWCQNYLPGFPVVLTERKDLLRGDLIIDDCVHHLQAFQGVKMVMDKPWNRDYTARGYRVFSWDQVLIWMKRIADGAEDNFISTMCCRPEQGTQPYQTERQW